MECSCSINADYDNGPSVATKEIRKARNEYVCCECRKPILKGSKYEYVRGLWEGYWSTYRTCIDCKSIRDSIFCNSPYEELWEYLNETDWNYSQPPSRCMMGLTKVARDKICDLIEESWD